jgi:hypothetical protein
MTMRLVELWAWEIFLPAVAEPRARFGYMGMVVLLLDGLGFHHTGEFLSPCANWGIDILSLAP